MPRSKEKEPCPWLPDAPASHGPHHTRSLPRKDGVFYLAALAYAQSLWLAGKPAQAILQLNKAWMADLGEDESILEAYPPPYRALRWMLRRAKTGEDGFMGNPVRHFQHLASRMSGPRPEARSWRAWACLHIASLELEGGGFPKDGEQIVREGLWIPRLEGTLSHIRRFGWKPEAMQILLALRDF